MDRHTATNVMATLQRAYQIPKHIGLSRERLNKEEYAISINVKPTPQNLGDLTGWQTICTSADPKKLAAVLVAIINCHDHR